MSDFQTDFDSLSWKEIAVILSRYLSSALVSHQTEMSDETMHEALGCCHQVTNRVIAERAAPAEDARAVGDEPLAWMLEGSVGGDSLDFQITDLLEVQNRHGGILVPLYRHPQRQVVLPERKTAEDYLHPGVNHIQAAQWNACLDEIERLSK